MAQQQSTNPLSSFLNHPFNAGGTALNWVLFVGLLIIAAWLWNTVLLAIEG